MPISVAWKNTSSTASHCVSFLPCLIPLVHITIVYCLYYSYNFLSCPSNCCLHFKKPAWLITIKSLTKSFLAENDDSTFTSPSSFKTYMSLFLFLCNSLLSGPKFYYSSVKSEFWFSAGIKGFIYWSEERNGARWEEKDSWNEDSEILFLWNRNLIPARIRKMAQVFRQKGLTGNLKASH